MKNTNRPILLFKDWHGGLNSQDAYYIYLLINNSVLIVLLSVLALTECVCGSSVSFGHPRPHVQGSTGCMERGGHMADASRKDRFAVQTKLICRPV